MRKFHPIAFLLLIIVSFTASAVTLKSGYPERYVVKEGDTLWDIAGQFLDKPWEWQTIWRGNPQIKNPKHLHPGAVLELQQVKGQPFLVMVKPGIYRLSPQSRTVPSHRVIPTIPLNKIKPFLNGSLVFDPEDRKRHGYIAAIEGEHLLASSGSEIYVRYLPPAPTHRYGFYRLKHTYHDPDSDELLGILGMYVGSGELTSKANPSTLVVKEALDSIQVKDLVFPNTSDDYPPCFDLRAPKKPVHGTVIDLINVLKDLGSQQVLVLNRGTREGIVVGDVLAVYKRPQRIRDLVQHVRVDLPAKRVGEILVFRTFKKTSFGLVMNATQPIERQYLVENP